MAYGPTPPRASSKDNIEALSAEDANAALEGLSPVRYVYKNSRDEEYVGFIAEDVPSW
ncbi:MAG: tail fiber domain-containing protein [Haliea sp.]|nr:tail fiber domain-containing protein [Haliea sp.]